MWCYGNYGQGMHGHCGANNVRPAYNMNHHHHHHKCRRRSNCGSSFVLLVVLFILLIIVGAKYAC